MFLLWKNHYFFFIITSEKKTKLNKQTNPTKLSNLQKPKFSDLSYDVLNLFQASMWLRSLTVVTDIALQVC